MSPLSAGHHLAHTLTLHIPSPRRPRRHTEVATKRWASRYVFTVSRCSCPDQDGYNSGGDPTEVMTRQRNNLDGRPLPVDGHNEKTSEDACSLADVKQTTSRETHSNIDWTMADAHSGLT